MDKNSKERIRAVLTVVGWFVIGFAVVALILFILKSGVI